MKVVITDHEYKNLKYEEEILNIKGINLEIHQCKTEEEVIEACHDADGIINLYAPITKKVIEKLEKCKVITRYGVGVDTIDINAATEKGIYIGNVPDYGVDEVSDHALMLILALVRKLNLSNSYVKDKQWDVNLIKPVRRINTLNVGLISFGNIPRRLSEKLKVLGVNILVYDPFIDKEVEDKYGVSSLSLDDLCEQSDVISVHAPLIKETKGMISKRQFELMKNSAYIVNTARGAVIDEKALITALEKNMIAGAALDVVENEPLSTNHPFLEMENVILTPHMAGYSEESSIELRQKAALGIKEVLIDKQYPKYLFNKSVKDKF